MKHELEFVCANCGATTLPASENFIYYALGQPTCSRDCKLQYVVEHAHERPSVPPLEGGGVTIG